MPELPEVETTRRGLLAHVVGRSICGVVVRNPNLRWPVPKNLRHTLQGERVLAIRRRGKYLLFDTPKGHLLVHLGMSGRISIVPEGEPARLHDHVDLQMDDRNAMRLTDPRRFGTVLWLDAPAEEHALLRGLGLEPYDIAFTGGALHRLAQGRRIAVKQFLMNSRIVTGIGNIYASEALWEARVHPERSAGRIGALRWDRIVAAIRTTLDRALAAGGSTLRDFASANGQPGHFQFQFAVYDREGEPCGRCRSPIRARRQGQRSTFYCPRCQR